MEENNNINELRLRSGRVVRRSNPYLPHQSLLQRQQIEQERRRFAATNPPQSRVSNTLSINYNLQRISPRPHIHFQYEDEHVVEHNGLVERIGYLYYSSTTLNIVYNALLPHESPSRYYEPIPSFNIDSASDMLRYRDFVVQRFTRAKLADDMEVLNGDTCVICMDAFTRGQLLRILPCTHKYHQGCIDEWLAKAITCPMCRTPVGACRSRQARHRLSVLSLPIQSFNYILAHNAEMERNDENSTDGSTSLYSMRDSDFDTEDLDPDEDFLLPILPERLSQIDSETQSVAPSNTLPVSITRDGDNLIQ